MSERWNPKRLLRDRAAQIARGEVPREQRIEQLEQDVLARRRKPLGGSTVAFGERDRWQGQTFDCNHGVNWRDCTICSRPRSRP